MWQSEAFDLKYQIALLSHVPCGQPVNRYRPEADSNCVHEVPKTPESFLREKRQILRKKSVFHFQCACLSTLSNNSVSNPCFVNV